MFQTSLSFCMCVYRGVKTCIHVHTHVHTHTHTPALVQYNYGYSTIFSAATIYFYMYMYTYISPKFQHACTTLQFGLQCLTGSFQQRWNMLKQLHVHDNTPKYMFIRCVYMYMYNTCVHVYVDNVDYTQ